MRSSHAVALTMAAMISATPSWALDVRPGQSFPIKGKPRAGKGQAKPDSYLRKMQRGQQQ